MNKRTILAVALLLGFASCVEPRVLVEDEQGLIYAVKRPSFEFPDTVIVAHAGVDVKVAYIAGVYRGQIPQADTIADIPRTYTKAVVYER